MDPTRKCIRITSCFKKGITQINELHKVLYPISLILLNIGKINCKIRDAICKCFIPMTTNFRLNYIQSVNVVRNCIRNNEYSINLNKKIYIYKKRDKGKVLHFELKGSLLCAVETAMFGFSFVCVYGSGTSHFCLTSFNRKYAFNLKNI